MPLADRLGSSAIPAFDDTHSRSPREARRRAGWREQAWTIGVARPGRQRRQGWQRPGESA